MTKTLINWLKSWSSKRNTKESSKIGIKRNQATANLFNFAKDIGTLTHKKLELEKIDHWLTRGGEFIYYKAQQYQELAEIKRAIEYINHDIEFNKCLSARKQRELLCGIYEEIFGKIIYEDSETLVYETYAKDKEAVIIYSKVTDKNASLPKKIFKEMPDYASIALYSALTEINYKDYDDLRKKILTKIKGT